MFLYPTPFADELKRKWGSKYRFDDELIDATLYMFKHPIHNRRWYKMCNQLMSRDDANDMLKAAYRLVEEFKENPQHYGGEMTNLVDQMLASMWAVFVSLHKRVKKNLKYGDYLQMAIGQMHNHATDVWLDVLVNATWRDEQRASQERIGLGTQEGKSRSNFDYLCSLGEDEIGSLL